MSPTCRELALVEHPEHDLHSPATAYPLPDTKDHVVIKCSCGDVLKISAAATKKYGLSIIEAHKMLTRRLPPVQVQ